MPSNEKPLSRSATPSSEKPELDEKEKASVFQEVQRLLQQNQQGPPLPHPQTAEQEVLSRLD